MGFKEDVSRRLEYLGRKTSGMLEEARLRGRIGALESEIKDLYTTVGTMMFSMWKHQNVDTGRLVKYFEAIRRKQEEIGEKKEQILQVKARSAGETAEEKPDKEPARPLLPDYGGRMAEGTAPEEPVLEGVAPAGGVVIEEEDDGDTLPGGEAVFGQERHPEIYCSRCGAACPADANFCRKCGMKLR